MSSQQPQQYNPDFYFIEGSDEDGGYHLRVSRAKWYVIALYSFPLRFFPLFKPYKRVTQRKRVLRFRSAKELEFLNH
jgi:hypothetical protein